MIKVNDIAIKQDYFCSGETKLKVDQLDNDEAVFTWNYENDSELFTLICLSRYFCRYPQHLVMPYLPHARMDRAVGNDVFTLKYFCEVINSLHFESVMITDPHSNVGPALLNNVLINDAWYHINNAIALTSNHLDEHNEVALFFPDEGAMKRYAFKFPGYKFAFGVKKRDWNTHKIESLDIIGAEAIKDKHVLIIDDICSYGNTFVRSAEALKAAGARSVSLYITHAENVIVKGDVFKHMDSVYTTHSLVHTPEVQKSVIYVD